MNTKDLIKSKQYRYTAGSEQVKVEYLHPTINGYVFTDGKVPNELHPLTVEKYIEEL